MFRFLAPIKQYTRLIVGVLVALLVAGALFYGYTQQLTISRLETTVATQAGTIKDRDNEITRLGGEIREAKAVNDQNLAELKKIQDTYAETLARIKTMNRELDTAKGKITDLKTYIATFNKPGDDGPIAPVLGATLERINQLEHPETEK